MGVRFYEHTLPELVRQVAAAGDGCRAALAEMRAKEKTRQGEIELALGESSPKCYYLHGAWRRLTP